MRQLSLCFSVILIAVVVFGVNLWAQDRPPVLVAVDTVAEMEFLEQVTLVGRTEASVESKIVAEVSGIVKSIDAAEGVWVKAGSPLVTIESDRTHYRLASKRAETEQAKLMADLAQTQRKRAEELYSQNLISNTGLDSAVAWAGITAEQYKQLEAEKDLLELDLKKSVISAPFSGYTGRLLVDVGEWVNPGMPVFEMVDISRAKVRVDLPERYYGRVSVGSQVTVMRPSAGDEVTGQITGIAPNASEETHTFPVIIEVANSDGKLGGGMLVRAVLSLDNKFTGLAVSKDALVRQGDRIMVYTVVDGKAAPIPVVTTSSNGQVVAVVSENLSSGMPVIVRGNERVFPGSPVQVMQQQKPGDAGQSSQQAAVDE